MNRVEGAVTQIYQTLGFGTLKNSIIHVLVPFIYSVPCKPNLNRNAHLCCFALARTPLHSGAHVHSGDVPVGRGMRMEKKTKKMLAPSCHPCMPVLLNDHICVELLSFSKSARE